MRTERATMAQALVRFLAAQTVERDGVTQPFFAGMWGIFGHGNVTGLGQALEETGVLPFYRPQNEQAMVHASIAYAKMKNRLQTFACTSSVGPGATNMVTGAATATVNRLPVLLLPGDTFASRLPHPVLQQLEHPMAMDISVNDAFRPVSRFWDRITRPEQLLSSLPEAMRILTDQAETGAVTICVPEDTQTEAYDYPAAFFEERVTTVYRNLPAREALDRAAELIRSAQRPLIIAGGGVIYSEATAELANFAERFGIPVCETQAGKGSLPWNHPLNVGPIGANGGLAANRLAAQADLVSADRHSLSPTSRPPRGQPSRTRTSGSQQSTSPPTTRTRPARCRSSAMPGRRSRRSASDSRHPASRQSRPTAMRSSGSRTSGTGPWIRSGRLPIRMRSTRRT